MVRAPEGALILGDPAARLGRRIDEAVGHLQLAAGESRLEQLDCREQLATFFPRQLQPKGKLAGRLLDGNSEHRLEAISGAKEIQRRVAQAAADGRLVTVNGDEHDISRSSRTRLHLDQGNPVGWRGKARRAYQRARDGGCRYAAGCRASLS